MPVRIGTHHKAKEFALRLLARHADADFDRFTRIVDQVLSADRGEREIGLWRPHVDIVAHNSAMPQCGQLAQWCHAQRVVGGQPEFARE